MNGIIERAIENWLINTNERSYQIPFCQILLSQGYEILYISPHGPLEMGKDIIAISPEGNTVAYQLKRGDLTLKEWDKIQREIYDLIDQKCKHPNVDKSKPHTSFIVTNGDIKDNVFQRIDAINETKKHYSELKSLNKDQILKMFLESNSNFLPQRFEDWGEFLSFFTLNGEDFLPRKKYYDFLRNHVLIKTGKQISSFKNTIFSSVILTSYILQTFKKSQNHYAQIETWTILYGSLISFIEQYKIPKDKEIDKTLEILSNEILDLCKSLEDEFLKSSDLFEGEIVGDGGLILRARITMVIGTLCCSNFNGIELKVETKEKILQNISQIWLWGESAFPYFFFIIKYLEKEDLNQKAINLLDRVLHGLLNQNYRYNENESLPSPYMNLNEHLKIIYCGEKHDFKQYEGKSYILNSVIDMMVRRDLRKELEVSWRKISHTECKSFIPDKEFEYFNLYNRGGTNFANFPKQKQSYEELKERSQRKVENLLFEKYKNILPMFLMVYPHRINEEITKFLDSELYRLGRKVPG